MASGIGGRFETWAVEAGIGIDVRRFPQGTRTAEDAAAAIGCSVGQIVKSVAAEGVLVHISSGTPLGVVLADFALLRHPPGTPGLMVGSTLHAPRTTILDRGPN